MRGKVAVECRRLAETEVNSVDLARLERALIRGRILPLIELNDAGQRDFVECCPLFGSEPVVIEQRNQRAKVGCRGSGGGGVPPQKKRGLIWLFSHPPGTH